MHPAPMAPCALLHPAPQDPEEGIVLTVSRPNSNTSNVSDVSIHSDGSKQSASPSTTSTIFGPEKEQVLSEKMRIIVEAFRSRARKERERLEQPPTPKEETEGGEEPR